MTTDVAIGEFSRLTHLSVKTLHHYHDVGLLEPSRVDAVTGYRRYSLDQVPRAHLIRRLRELDMPVAEVQAVVTAPDPAARDAVLRGHLAQMEAELTRTRGVVTSLRELLEPVSPLDVEIRSSPAQRVFTLSDLLTRDAVYEWCAAAFDRLCAETAGHGIEPEGHAGATYTRAFFEDAAGDVVAFVPVPEGAETVPGLESRVLGGGRFAIAVHAGSYDDFDRTYGALGSYVAERGLARTDATDEPIRELYVVGPDDTDDPAAYLTEVWWPIRTDTPTATPTDRRSA